MTLRAVTDEEGERFAADARAREKSLAELEAHARQAIAERGYLHVGRDTIKHLWTPKPGMGLACYEGMGWSGLAQAWARERGWVFKPVAGAVWALTKWREDVDG